MAKSQKLLKEDFVSNLSGGSVSEINLVCTVAPAAYLLWSALQCHQKFFTLETPAAFLTDFLLNVGGILFATTLYSSHPPLLLALLISPALLLLVLPKRNAHRKSPKTTSDGVRNASEGDSRPRNLPIRPFITAYRGAMMIVTCLSILAVDFRVFPRRFAKTENWGTSLMDVGVGSFVFSAGIVAARPILSPKSIDKPRIWDRLQHSIRHSAPLFILGLVRFYSVKGLDYAEHVSEYGVHWNFFFTLAFLPPAVALLGSLPYFIQIAAPLALIISCVYQVMLESTNLKAYILTAPRGHDFLSQNREGVFSFAGYLAIFLAGQGLGLQVLPDNRKTGKSAWIRRRNLLFTIVLWEGFSGLLYLGTTWYNLGQNIPVSRRLANLPYVLWITTTNAFLLLLFALVETIYFPAVYRLSETKKSAEAERQVVEFATSKILGAFNKNGLAIFLVANLGTGAVNLGVDTLSAGPEKAMGILIVYSAVITAVAVGLDHYNISVKL